jgi:hypothetical protein
MTAVNDYWAKWRQADAAAAGAVIFFFGLMEVLFDACFAFGDRRGITYFKFRGRHWKERFRFVMDVTCSPATEVYEKLLRVQQRYRNVFTHALPTFFVLNERLGWIPREAEHLTEPRMNPMFAFDPDEVRSTFALFDAAMSLFENHDTTWAATMYAKTPLPIPLASERVAVLLKHVTSRDAFENEIDRRLGFLDAVANGEF